MRRQINDVLTIRMRKHREMDTRVPWTCEKTSCCRLEIVSALLTVSMAVSFILVSFMAL